MRGRHRGPRRVSVRAFSSRRSRAPAVARRRGDPAAPEGVRDAAGAGRERRAAGHEAGAARHGVAGDGGRGEQPQSQRVGAAQSAGRKATGQQYIETVPRVGYRFAAPVETLPAAQPGAAASIAVADAAPGDPVLHDERRRPARLCHHRQRTAAREGVELAHASRLRMGQPDLAALVRARSHGITGSFATTSAATACRSATSPT